MHERCLEAGAQVAPAGTPGSSSYGGWAAVGCRVTCPTRPCSPQPFPAKCLPSEPATSSGKHRQRGFEVRYLSPTRGSNWHRVVPGQARRLLRGLLVPPLSCWAEAQDGPAWTLCVLPSLAASPPPLGLVLGQIRHGRENGDREGTQDYRRAPRWRPGSQSVGVDGW